VGGEPGNMDCHREEKFRILMNFGESKEEVARPLVLVEPEKKAAAFVDILRSTRSAIIDARELQ